MAWVADYTNRIDPAALKAAGVVGVCRYVSRSSWKVIDQAEYDELTHAGLTVILNFEDEASGWLGGAAAGRDDAAFAADAADALGYPKGSPIPSSADFNMTQAQWSGAGALYAMWYMEGLRARGYEPGVYGPWDVLRWCLGIGYGWFWQSMSTAFSGGRNAQPWPGAQLRQRYQTAVGGLQVDHNDILQPDWQGGDMAALQADDPSYLDLIYGVKALLLGENPTGGPSAKVRPNAVQPLLKQIQAAVAAAGAPTQDQLDASVAKVMSDPAWLDALAAKLAGHIHVS